jgi:hypothetical protein
MGVNDMTHIHIFAQQLCRRRNRHTAAIVEGLGGHQMVGGGADPADTGGYLRQGVGLHADENSLKAAQLVDAKEGFFDLAVFITVEKDAGVPLNSRNRIDFYGF